MRRGYGRLIAVLQGGRLDQLSILVMQFDARSTRFLCAYAHSSEFELFSSL